MVYQIVYESEKDPLPHNVYEWIDPKGSKEWRRSFATDAEAHRWIKENCVFTNVR